MAGDDRFPDAVRRQLHMGRLLPLGDAADGAWLAEDAAAGVLRAAAEAVPGVRLGSVRLSPAEHRETAAPEVTPPPAALPHVPLRLDADFAATADMPLPAVGGELRRALLTAADEQLGLRVAAADLRVSELLDAAPGTATEYAESRGSAQRAETEPQTEAEAQPDTEARAQPGAEAGAVTEPPPAPADSPASTATAEAVIAVPGVTRLAPVLGMGLRARGAAGTAVRRVATNPPQIQVQLAVAADARALDVSRLVRRAAAKAALWDAGEGDGAAGRSPVTVSVLVTAVDRRGRRRAPPA